MRLSPGARGVTSIVSITRAYAPAPGARPPRTRDGWLGFSSLRAVGLTVGARGGRWLVDPELQKWLATRSNGGSLGPLWGYGDGVGHSSSRWSARYPRGTGSSGWLEFAGDAGVRGSWQYVPGGANLSPPATLGRGKLRPREPRTLDCHLSFWGAAPFRTPPRALCPTAPFPARSFQVLRARPLLTAHLCQALQLLSRSSLALRRARTTSSAAADLLAPPPPARHWSAGHSYHLGLVSRIGALLALPGSRVALGFPRKVSPWATPIGWLMRWSRVLSCQ